MSILLPCGVDQTTKGVCSDGRDIVKRLGCDAILPVGLEGRDQDGKVLNACNDLHTKKKHSE